MIFSIITKLGLSSNPQMESDPTQWVISSRPRLGGAPPIDFRIKAGGYTV